MTERNDRKLHILQVNKAYYPHIGGIESLVRIFSREMQVRGQGARLPGKG